ncbi:hypothetical protein ACQKE4_20130 [Halomonas sp. NPDC076908]|uniref:hypothetical protein n=1 Tax=Halomonas sp. NPDC076908 TaxID=3390567 RepID=UPI003D05322D
MKPHADTISAVYVVAELIPKLNAVEKHIEQTINAVLNTSQLPTQIERYTKLQVEFQLELTMIRLNLEHLLKRYNKELEAVINDPRQDVLLTLGQHESVAVESVKTLYNRVQRLQQAR